VLHELKGSAPASTIPSRELLVVSALFVLLTIGATYPQIIRMSSHVGTHYDALFSIWRLAWVAHQLPRDPLHLFDANIFYPERNTLAYSDAMLLPALIAAPLIWIGVSPVVVYNVLILLSFATACVGMYVLVRTLTGCRAAGIFSGVPFAFQAYRFAHYPQLELLWTCFIPLALWALHRTFVTQRARDGALLGLFTGLQAWACLYYAVFLATALTIVSIVLLIGHRLRDIGRLAKAGAVAVVICLLMSAPYALPYLKARETVGTREEAEIRQWSPTLKAYIATTPESWLYGRITDGFGYLEGTMFPGVVPVVLACCALFGRWGRVQLAYLLLLAITFDLSLGLNGWLYSWLYQLVWPYQGLRVPARLFVLVSTALALLSGFGLVRIMAALRHGAMRRVAAVVLTALALIEALAIPLPLDPLEREHTNADAFLAVQPPTVVMEWPVPRPDNLGVTHDPLYMLRSTAHWQSLVNGYSGFHPSSYIEFLERMKRFPDPSAVRYLQRIGVRYVVLHSEPDPVTYAFVMARMMKVPELQIISLERLIKGDVALFELRPE
jgi:hypothetical protein